MSERVHRRKETRNPIPGGTVAAGSDWLKKRLQAVGRAAPGVTLTFSGVVSPRKRSDDQVIHIRVVATTKPRLLFRKSVQTRFLIPLPPYLLKTTLTGFNIRFLS